MNVVHRSEVLPQCNVDFVPNVKSSGGLVQTTGSHLGATGSTTRVSHVDGVFWTQQRCRRAKTSENDLLHHHPLPRHRRTLANAKCRINAGICSQRTFSGKGIVFNFRKTSMMWFSEMLGMARRTQDQDRQEEDWSKTHKNERMEPISVNMKPVQ